MERRWTRGALVRLALAGAVLGWFPGCLEEATHRQFLRHRPATKTAVEKGSSAFEEPAESKDMTGADGETILKGNRHSGAWSSEAAEIESHLGASR